MLTALNICDEVDVQTYKTNANADYLAHPSRLGGMKFISGTTMRNMANVIPYMRANGGVFHQFPDASKGQKSPAEVAYGMPLWELFRKEPEVLADFSAYLSGRRENIVSQWFNIFPAAERLSQQLSEEKEGEGGAASDRPLIVDVGGNIGYDLTNFKKQYPNLSGQLILQDLPENITKAKKLLDGTGIESMEYDFFTPQPVKGTAPVIPPLSRSTYSLHVLSQQPSRMHVANDFSRRPNLLFRLHLSRLARPRDKEAPLQYRRCHGPRFVASHRRDASSRQKRPTLTRVL